MLSDAQIDVVVATAIKTAQQLSEKEAEVFNAMIVSNSIDSLANALGELVKIAKAWQSGKLIN